MALSIRHMMTGQFVSHVAVTPDRIFLVRGLTRVRAEHSCGVGLIHGQRLDFGVLGTRRDQGAFQGI